MMIDQLEQQNQLAFGKANNLSKVSHEVLQEIQVQDAAVQLEDISANRLTAIYQETRGEIEKIRTKLKPSVGSEGQSKLLSKRVYLFVNFSSFKRVITSHN